MTEYSHYPKGSASDPRRVEYIVHMRSLWTIYQMKTNYQRKTEVPVRTSEGATQEKFEKKLFSW